LSVIFEEPVRENWHIRPIISEYSGPNFTKFSKLVEVRVGMINLTFVFRSLNGCRYSISKRTGVSQRRWAH